MVTVHTRNKMRRHTYSFIEQVAIRVGRNLLFEIDPKHFLINNMLMEDGKTKFPFQILSEERGNDKDPVVTIDKLEKKSYKIDWGTGSFVIVKAKGIFMNVEIDGTEADFGSSVGLMGKYGTGELLDRQGNPMSEDDFIAYGMEWQVNDKDPKLFTKAKGPQWPEKCMLPNPEEVAVQRRNLRGDNDINKVAEKACAGALDFEAVYWMWS